MKWLTKGYAFDLRAAMVLKSTVKVKHKSYSNQAVLKSYYRQCRNFKSRVKSAKIY